jgi:hypothetical protein
MSYSLSFSKAILVVIFISDKTRQNQFEFLSTASLSEDSEYTKANFGQDSTEPYC